MIRRFAKSIIYLACLAVVAGALYYLSWIRALLDIINNPLVEYIVGDMSALAAGVTRPFAYYGLLVLEALALAWILSQLVRIPVGALVPSMTVGQGTQWVIMVVGVLSSAYMAMFAYSILWGDVTFNNVVLMKAQNPATISFAVGISLGTSVLWYAVAQSLPFAVRSRVSIPWTLSDTLTSAIYVGVVASAWYSYRFGSYAYSPYRLGAMSLFVPSAVVDVINLAISFRLMARGWLGGGQEEERVIVAGHH